MVGNRLGVRLSRLVRERAYLAGTLPDLGQRVDGLKAELKQAKETLRGAQARLASIDSEIAALSAIIPTDIRPIRSMPRKMTGAHGEFRRELVRVLKEAEGAVETVDLVKHMAATFSLSLVTKEDRDRVRYLVRRPLNVFRLKGAVERLPSVSETGSGVWRWIADQTEA